MKFIIILGLSLSVLVSDAQNSTATTTTITTIPTSAANSTNIPPKENNTTNTTQSSSSDTKNNSSVVDVDLDQLKNDLTTAKDSCVEADGCIDGLDSISEVVNHFEGHEGGGYQVEGFFRSLSGSCGKIKFREDGCQRCVRNYGVLINQAQISGAYCNYNFGNGIGSVYRGCSGKDLVLAKALIQSQLQLCQIGYGPAPYPIPQPPIAVPYGAYPAPAPVPVVSKTNYCYSYSKYFKNLAYSSTCSVQSSALWRRWWCSSNSSTHTSTIPSCPSPSTLSSGKIQKQMYH
jgi:hypothetical protein